ncbi:D-erythronate dehydrogenase [Sphingomonas profundi]|uniref:D-erythronate dehydrogenase n=1 Tax=Alterirhizorhabdus profundi TaxID=2681549 RepID=UPI0012E758A0|nr:D-erythronate dehydrogenase [Sphingomonas profundi]
MDILITGGAGFLGLKLARRLLRDGLDGRPIDRLVLVDRVAAPDWGDARVEMAVGDIADATFVASVVWQDFDIIYHLAAVVSGQAEADFDLGLRVNIDASRLLLDIVRAAGGCPRVIFTSSVAVFGPVTDDAMIGDATSVDPRSSYGMEKAVAELLLRDYSRRGFVDGLVLRLPTISVRPGRPNQAASSFASGIIREPMAGEAAICPVPLSTTLWLLSPRQAVAALVRAGEMPTEALGTDRVVNLPGISVTVDDMLAALARQEGPDILRLIRQVPDPAIERIVASWPRAWDDQRARALGFAGDADFHAILRAFVEDDLPAATRNG